MRSLRDHGATVSDLQRHHSQKSYIMPEYDMVGFNYRMTDIQGAVGVAQMRKFNYIMGKRSEIARRYDDALAELSWLRTPYTPDAYVHGYQSYVCLFAPEEPTMDNVEELHAQRNTLMDQLEEKGIATRQGTQAVHTLGYYREKYSLRPEDYPNAYIADRLTLALPLYVQFTDNEQAYTVKNLKEKREMSRRRV
jgi:dTDP-4-amino-4,6-dideoxygalactose transaminase